jgi:hypothetical protein
MPDGIVTAFSIRDARGTLHEEKDSQLTLGLQGAAFSKLSAQKAAKLHHPVSPSHTFSNKFNMSALKLMEASCSCYFYNFQRSIYLLNK